MELNNKRWFGVRAIMLLLVTTGVIFTSCKDSSISGIEEKEEIMMAAQIPGNTVSGNETANLYISNNSIDTWDRYFPKSEDPNWATTVCYQENTFGINNKWLNQHDAFEVGTHPLEQTYDFDAKWINSYNNLDSEGQNWSKYETQVSGEGDFVIQLLADNCSWVYLDNELIGYQDPSITNTAYGVSLDGAHTLSFVIFDGGGLAGGKFRLETTESYGNNPPPPIGEETPVNNAPVANAGPDQTLEATGTTTQVNLTGSATDADGDALTYSWSNGAIDSSTIVNLSLGVHTFTLTVSDGTDSDTDEVVITIVNESPVADAVITAFRLGTNTVFNGSSSTDPNDTIVSYFWDFGDGSTSSEVVANHSYSISGEYTASLTVTDSFGDSDTVSTTFIIKGLPFIDYDNDGLFNARDRIIPIWRFRDGEYQNDHNSVVIPPFTPNISAKRIHIKAKSLTVSSVLTARNGITLEAKKGRLNTDFSTLKSNNKISLKGDGISINNASISAKEIDVNSKDDLIATTSTILAKKKIELASKQDIDISFSKLRSDVLDINAKGVVIQNGTIIYANRIKIKEGNDRDNDDEDEDDDDDDDRKKKKSKKKKNTRD